MASGVIALRAWSVVLLSLVVSVVETLLSILLWGEREMARNYTLHREKQRKTVSQRKAVSHNE